MVDRMIEEDNLGLSEIETSETETKQKILKEITDLKEGLKELKAVEISKIQKGLAECRLELIKFQQARSNRSSQHHLISSNWEMLILSKKLKRHILHVLG